MAQEVTAPPPADPPSADAAQIAPPGGPGDSASWAESFDLKRLFAFDAARSIPLIIGLIILWVWFDLATPHGTYLGGQNISNILVDASQIGVVAIGVVVVLLMAEIDLSLGSLVALCGCSSALIMQEWVPNAPDFERMLVGVAASVDHRRPVRALEWFLDRGRSDAVLRRDLGRLLAFQGIALLITNSPNLGVTSPYFNAFGSTYSTVWNNGKLANLWGNEKDILHLSIGMMLGLVSGPATLHA